MTGLKRCPRCKAVLGLEIDEEADKRIEEWLSKRGRLPKPRRAPSPRELALVEAAREAAYTLESTLALIHGEARFLLDGGCDHLELLEAPRALRAALAAYEEGS